MKSFGLVTCDRKDDDTIFEDSYIKRLIKKLKEFIISFRKDKLFKNSLKKIDFVQDLELILITLPYSMKELETISKRRIKQINKFIQEVCLINNISNCILPEAIAKIHSFDKCILNPFKGEYLYKCLLANIIDEILTKKGNRIWEIDIVIIQGNNRKFLYSIIELLSPMVRFLTIISNDKEAIEEDVGESFLDSGLAVIVTNDWKNSLKDTDLIINLDEEKGYLAKAKLCNESTIINISKLNTQNIICSGPLINGISVKSPYDISEIITKNRLDCLKVVEIAELLILHAIDAEKDIYGDIYPDIDKMKHASKMFLKLGFRMTGYVGRYNVLKPESINPGKAI